MNTKPRKPVAPTVRGMLQQLIATPSVSSVSEQFDQSNRAVIELLAQWLADIGFEVDVLPLPTQKHKANLIATLGKGDGGLVLAGHTDTVPCDADRWSHDPFELTEQQGRLYGLGTSDMKSFFALAIEAAQQFDAKDFKQPLIILATADEESSMDGAKALVELGLPKARYAIIGEPTGLKPIRQHKGILMECIRLQGLSGHSSDPTLGVNALEAMNKVISDLMIWRELLQKKYRDAHFAVPVPTMNFGHIHGGDNPNRICGQCELHIDMRPLPGMDVHELRYMLNQRLQALFGDSRITWEVRSLIDGTPPMETNAQSAIVQAAKELTGHDAGSVAFCTEGPYLNSMGMESLILGPGDIEQAHQPDEFIAVDRLGGMVELLVGFIRRFCL